MCNKYWFPSEVAWERFVVELDGATIQVSSCGKFKMEELEFWVEGETFKPELRTWKQVDSNNNTQTIQYDIGSRNIYVCIDCVAATIKVVANGYKGKNFVFNGSATPITSNSFTVELG